jgi:hypothetical protein
MRAIPIAGVAVVSLLASTSCGTPCAAGLVRRVSFPATIGTVAPCCGGFVTGEVSIRETHAQIDLALSADSAADARLDGWITKSTCAALFSPRYTGPGSETPQCEVILGPVAAGATSSRVDVPPGDYRLFIQSWAGNKSPLAFTADVGVWAPHCISTLTSP